METTLVSFWNEPEGEETTYYSDCARERRKECEELGIPHHIEHWSPDPRVKTENPWLRNCNQKPFFILHMFELLRRPFFWVDIDCPIGQAPVLMDSLKDKCDIASGKFDWKQWLAVPLRIMDTVHFFNYTPVVEKFLLRWREECEHIGEGGPWAIGDHRMFNHVFIEMEKDLRFEYLPKTYIYGPVIHLGLAKGIEARTRVMRQVHQEMKKIRTDAAQAKIRKKQKKATQVGARKKEEKK